MTNTSNYSAECASSKKRRVQSAIGILVESTRHHGCEHGISVGGRHAVDLRCGLSGVFRIGEGEFGHLSCVGVFGEEG